MAKSKVIINDRTARAVSEVKGLTADRLTEFVETAVEMMKDAPSSGGAPRLSGNMADTIDIKKESDAVFEVFTTTGYGAYVELGTSRQSPNPFMSRNVKKAAHVMERTPYD